MESETSTLGPAVKRHWLWRLWPLYAVVGVFALLYLFTGGRGGIGQFNPHTLQSRSQSEITILLGQLPVYRSSFNYYDRPLLQELLKRGYVKPEEDRDRWDWVFHWNDAWKGGYGIWYDTLSRHDEALIDWTRANPALAKIFWSEAFRYMRSEYEVDQQTGRDLLQMGWKASDEAALRKLIHELRVDALQWARLSDSPAEKSYAEAEYQKLWPRKSRR